MTCPCGKKTRDDAYLCDDDRAKLRELLTGTHQHGDMAWLDAQLEVSRSRQRAPAAEPGSRSVETPLPFHDKASLARRHLSSVLLRWVRVCAADSVRSTATPERFDSLGYLVELGYGRPRQRPVTIPAMARWLLHRVDGLALHPSGYDALEQIEQAIEGARNVVFWKPTPQVYLGRCEGHECACACHTGFGYACSETTCTQPDAPDSAEPCDGDVYAPEGEDVGTCRICRTGYSVAIKRKGIEAELDDMLYTATEIGRLAAFLGLGMGRDAVRNLITSWHTRGRLTAVDHQGRQGAARFRYSEAKTQLYAHKTRRENASA